MSKISIHYTGDIVTDHKISLKVLSKTTSCLQGAINRAYLDNKYGGVWKHARISGVDNKDIAFLVGPARPGGFILDAICDTNIGKRVITRLTKAMTPVYENLQTSSVEEAKSLREQFPNASNSLLSNTPASFDEFSRKIEYLSRHSYGDRSILKEIDQLLSILRSKFSGESQLELTIDAGTPFFTNSTK